MALYQELLRIPQQVSLIFTSPVLMHKTQAQVYQVPTHEIFQFLYRKTTCLKISSVEGQKNDVFSKGFGCIRQKTTLVCMEKWQKNIFCMLTI